MPCSTLPYASVDMPLLLQSGQLTDTERVFSVAINLPSHAHRQHRAQSRNHARQHLDHPINFGSGRISGQAETDRAVGLIRRISEGRTLMIVEHDMGVVFGLADRISVLVYGEIIATGPPAEIRASAKVKEAYLGEEAHA